MFKLSCTSKVFYCSWQTIPNFNNAVSKNQSINHIFAYSLLPGEIKSRNIVNYRSRNRSKPVVENFKTVDTIRKPGLNTELIS